MENPAKTPNTLAQLLFHEKQILTVRPEGMEYNDYRTLIKIQNKILNKLFKSKPSRKIGQLMPIRLNYNSHLL